MKISTTIHAPELSSKEEYVKKHGKESMPPPSKPKESVSFPPQTLPSNWEMIKNLAQAAREAIASGLEVRSPEDVEKALEICATCPKLVNDGGWFRCGMCGCGIGYSTPGMPNQLSKSAKLGKLAMKSWHCPIGKW